jgi:hypothetical protein
MYIIKIVTSNSVFKYIIQYIFKLWLKKAIIKIHSLVQIDKCDSYFIIFDKDERERKKNVKKNETKKK